MRERPNVVAAMAVVAGIVLASAPAGAQERSDARMQPYTFAAPGGISNGGTSLHLGGGIEVLAWKGLGASFEGGYVGPLPDGFDYGIGVVSANAFYQFGRPQRRKVTPFVTGGYSLGFRSQSVNAVNVGAGVNYWLSEGVALRLELRDHIPIENGLRDEHLWGARVGFTWRR
jgi:hypothetical protein